MSGDWGYYVWGKGGSGQVENKGSELLGGCGDRTEIAGGE